jgi:hypothetical protein
MHSVGAAAPSAALPDMSARAQASRINGARSRGPRTPEGKARSSQNALKHGLRAQRFVVLADEDAAEYEAHEDALLAELAPEGALQTLLARRVAAAAWRLVRADRIEAELFEQQGNGDGDLGLALIRDGHGARAFQTLLRYRGGAEAGLWRALRALKALQAEAAQAERADLAAPMPARTRALKVAPAPQQPCRRTAVAEMPNEPDGRRIPDQIDSLAAAAERPAPPPPAATAGEEGADGGRVGQERRQRPERHAMIHPAAAETVAAMAAVPQPAGACADAGPACDSGFAKAAPRR